ncbi:lysophospholipid acyltransferase family protein [Streptantibioticus parmotrematis]|uniref:lysophospholipid acyltransferase family protein n=1 Tax=Streptantibioticus parmotrematis TaxID=2873249 RepID=UPI00340046F1
MLTSTAAAVVPVFGRLTISDEAGGALASGGIVAANHTSLADPALVLAALHRVGVRPVVLAAAGLWRIPLLGRMLTREGCVPVHRDSGRGAIALEAATAALAAGRHILIYGEGRLPRRRDAGEAAPESFRSGLARLALESGAPVLPVGQAGARRFASGHGVKQVSGVLTAPLRRPRAHVHFGAPVHLTGRVPDATAQARDAVTAAWRTAVETLGEPVVLAA